MLPYLKMMIKLEKVCVYALATEPCNSEADGSLPLLPTPLPPTTCLLFVFFPLFFVFFSFFLFVFLPFCLFVFLGFLSFLAFCLLVFLSFCFFLLFVFLADRRHLLPTPLPPTTCLLFVLFYFSVCLLSVGCLFVFLACDKMLYIL